MARTQDGSELLTGPGAGGLLRSAVGNSGGVLHSWQLDHVDHRPGRSTKALYRTMVSWPDLDGPQASPREELFGASAHIGEREKDLYVAEQTLVMTDGDINVRVWRYPHDPWLPMLPHVCYPDAVGRTLRDLGVDLGGGESAPISIEVVSYRPGRRAVLRASQGSGPQQRAVFLKVMQPLRSGDIVDRHQRLLAAGVPVPEVIAHHEGLVVLKELPGRPLAMAVVEEGEASCRGEDLVALLDRLPASMYTVSLRPPWTDSVEFYAGIVSSSLPTLAPRLDALVRSIRDGLAALERRQDMRPHDVVHGDFYEAQVFVEGGRVVGLLDIDTVGPGRRADDLACLLAHLSVLADYGNSGRIDRGMQQRVEGAVAAWQRVFDERVDPTELALRSAGVVLSLATGPHRQQEAAWEAATEAIVRVAEGWVERARRLELDRARAAQAAQSAQSVQTGQSMQTGQSTQAGSVPPAAPSVPPMSSAPVPSGPVPSAPVPSGPAPSGAIPSGAIPSGPLPSAPPALGPAPSGTIPSGPAGVDAPTEPIPTGYIPAAQQATHRAEPAGMPSDEDDEPTQERRVDQILRD